MRLQIIFLILILTSCNRSSGTILECGGGGEFACPAGTFCKLSEECGGVDEKGICSPLPPEVCPTKENFVCGCNGKTFTNECMANAAKVSVDYTGPCIDKNNQNTEQKGKKFDFPDTKLDIDPSAVENAGDRDVEEFEDSVF